MSTATLTAVLSNDETTNNAATTQPTETEGGWKREDIYTRFTSAIVAELERGVRP